MGMEILTKRYYTKFYNSIQNSKASDLVLGVFLDENKFFLTGMMDLDILGGEYFSLFD